MKAFCSTFILLSLLSRSHADGGKEGFNDPEFTYARSYSRDGLGPGYLFTVNRSQLCSTCDIFVAQGCHSSTTPNDRPTTQHCDLAFLPIEHRDGESTCKTTKGTFHCYSGRDKTIGKGGCSGCRHSSKRVTSP
ncbi:hypothetical protein PGTUg99_036412 [Puccinia graminis f. sp. tritici]|uniref:Secreted protein n=1 Tax=Puccinia graminis f. sp. tritici TaxID=56615 RepID=A0A5B0SFM7_PUCGR|nr:hypothetical protein PGTUg99_036412 [Puccinia graminis f. sp. tritici]